MRLDIERQKKLEPKRMEACKKSLEQLGYEVIEQGGTTLEFMHKGSKIKLFPYSGWHTGKTIVDGRGFDKLLKQLKFN